MGIKEVFFKGWLQSELYLIKRTEHTIYMYKLLPPPGFEPGSLDAVNR